MGRKADICMNNIPSLDTRHPPKAVARYFLRRLALAHLKFNNPSVRYNNALADTIATFVAFPAVAISSFIVILSFRWAPTTVAKWFRISPWAWIAAIVVISMVGGHWALNRQLKCYRDEWAAYLEFARESDKRIVSWQRFISLVLCGLVIPFVALLLAFGTQVITKAFD
jgi:hypothetical protein